MAYEVFLPKLGANMIRGKIDRWFVLEGERVEHGDPLFELETDKATVDVEAECRGVLRKILVHEGETVPIVTTVAIIAEPDEDIDALLDEIKNRPVEKEQAPMDVSVREVLAVPETGGIPKPETTISESEKLQASPKARKRAKDAGIDISLVLPGEGRRIITLNDVENYVSSGDHKKKCVIIGAGEYSGVIREILELNGKVEIAGYIDDNPEMKNKNISGIPVLGGAEIFKDLASSGIAYFIVSVGAPVKRASLYQKALEFGLKPISAIHPRSCVSGNAVIEGGSVIEAFAVIAVRARLCRGVYVTQNCSVSHDCFLGEFSHLAPGCHLGGAVKVGRGVLIGVGASVAPHLTIGDNSIITPGSSVDKTIPPNVVVEGCPGRIIGKKSEKYRLPA